MNKIKRYDYDSIIKNPKPKPKPKTWDNISKSRSNIDMLRYDCENIVRANIRDEIIRDDIWLFIWTEDSIEDGVDIVVNRIKDRVLLAPRTQLENITQGLIGLEWR